MGMNLKDALGIAKALGCAVTDINRTGEVAVVPPDKGEKRLRINKRRKDAPAVLLTLIRRLKHEQVLAGIDQAALSELLKRHEED